MQSSGGLTDARLFRGKVTLVAGVRMRAPMLSIHTAAAGRSDYPGRSVGRLARSRFGGLLGRDQAGGE